MLGGFGIAVCLGWAGVRLNFQGEAEGNSGCTCCSLRLLCGGVSTCSRGCCVAVCVGSGDNRETIHARSDCCLQPLSLSARSLCALHSIISFSVIYILCLSLCRLCQIAIIHTLSFVFSNLSVCLSVSPSSPLSVSPITSLFQQEHIQEHKHKQQQLGAVIVLLRNSMAFSVKDGVVNNKLHITTKSPQPDLRQL